jgi:SAM-dependent methyltransferase
LSKTIKDCPLCSVEGASIGTSIKAEVYQCPNCELCFLDGERRLNTKNDNEWYSEFNGKGPDVAEFLTKEMTGPYSRQLGILERLTSGRKILDVGCGLGIFLNVAKSLGWDVSGTETSPHAIDFSNRHFSIHNTDFLKIPPGFYDVIRLSHVLEHIPDPVSFLDQIHDFLKVEGVLVVIVPNREPLLEYYVNLIRKAFMTKPRLAGAIYPDMHVLGFSIKSLVNLVTKSGFKVLRSETVSMGNNTYYPFFYDGLLRKRLPRSLRQIRYDLTRLASQAGVPFGKGEWIVAYFRK